MKNLLISIIVILLSISSVVNAIDIMGPPFGIIEKKAFNASFDFTFSKWNLAGSGSGVRDEDVTLDDNETYRFFGGVGYGLTDGWDIYGKAGAGEVEIDDERVKVNSDYDLIWAVGSRYTIHQEDRWIIGTVGQFTMYSGDDSESRVRGTTSDIDLDMYEFQIGLGLGYDMDGWIFYGGPFLYYVNGDIEADTVTGRHFTVDLEQETAAGIFIGALFEMRENAHGLIEYLVSPDGYGAGATLFFDF